MSDKKTEDELEAELDREIDARLEDYLEQFKRAAIHFFTQERALIRPWAKVSPSVDPGLRSKYNRGCKPHRAFSMIRAPLRSVIFAPGQRLTAADRSAEGSGDLLSPSPQAEHPERREHQTRQTSADDRAGNRSKGVADALAENQLIAIRLTANRCCAYRWRSWPELAPTWMTPEQSLRKRSSENSSRIRLLARPASRLAILCIGAECFSKPHRR
jgi:hypothetical protein